MNQRNTKPTGFTLTEEARTILSGVQNKSRYVSDAIVEKSQDRMQTYLSTLTAIEVLTTLLQNLQYPVEPTQSPIETAKRRAKRI